MIAWRASWASWAEGVGGKREAEALSQRDPQYPFKGFKDGQPHRRENADRASARHMGEVEHGGE